MMFRCFDCGHLFEEGEQAIWYKNQGECHGRIAMEKFGGCPICKGDYEEVRQCEECGNWHAEDELYDGWCEKCLRETINYDTFFEYCEANKDEQYLDTFVMCEILNCEYVPKISSDEFHELMVATYKKRVEEAALHNWTQGCIPEEKRRYDDFIDRCIRFIMDDDGSIGRENYADWLNNHYGKIDASKIACGNLDSSKIRLAE